MDERQQQVKVGAGLEESRINQELIDWLNKWGFRILIVVLLVVAAYQGKRWMDQRQINATNEAFVRYQEAALVNDPAQLVKLGDEYDGVASLWELSNLRAARILLVEGTRGMQFGTVNPSQPTEEELLSTEERTQRLEQAERLFASVAERASKDDDKALIALQAMLGRGTALLSLGKLDEAKTVLERVRDEGEAAGFRDVSAFASERLGLWEQLANPPQIVANADLPDSLQPESGGALDVPSMLDFQSQAGERLTPPQAQDNPEIPGGLTADPGSKPDPYAANPNVTTRTLDPDEDPEMDSPADTPEDEPEDEPAEAPSDDG